MEGLGTLMRKGLEGYEAGEDRLALEESRKTGLDDQKFQSQRRKTVAEREDTKYDRSEEQYQRSSKGKDVINNYMVNGDFGGVQDYLNDYTRDGADHYLKKNKDGSVDGILEIDGKQVKKNFKTDDELMQYVMMVSKNDPFAVLDEQRKTKTAAGIKAGEQAHDIAKIDRKGGWDLKIAGLKESKKGGKGSEALRKVANDMENRSKSRRGQMTALGNYDMAGISANLANYDGQIGVRLHDELGMDTNEAYTKAYDMVSALHKKAEEEAIQQFPDDDVKQTEYIRATLQRGTAQIVESIAKKARGTQSKQSQPGKKTKTASTKAPEYGQFLKDFKAKNKGATDADAKRMYGEWFPTAKSEAKPETKPKAKTKQKGLVEPNKKLSFKEEVELYRTPTRKPTKGFKAGGDKGGAKAKQAANKAANNFKKGVKLSEPELRLALNSDASERIKRSIIKEIKKIKAERKEQS